MEQDVYLYGEQDICRYSDHQDPVQYIYLWFIYMYIVIIFFARKLSLVISNVNN